MSKCDTCKFTPKYGGDGWSYCDGCVHDSSLKDRFEPATNADRIRAMSDEELAEFIPNWSYTDACKCGEHYVDCNNECEKCVAEWLQQPYISEDIKSSGYIEKDIEGDA